MANSPAVADNVQHNMETVSNDPKTFETLNIISTTADIFQG